MAGDAVRRVGLEARVRLAGAGLSEGMIEWGRRPAETPCAVITPRDLRLLAALHDYGYLTTGLCALLFWGRETYAARRRLKLLHDVGLVERVRPRSIYHGGGEWIYRLSSEGWRWLLNHEMTADGEDYTPAEVTSIAYLEHDLQVNALIAGIALRAAETGGTRDRGRALLDCAPFSWRGPRSGTIDPRIETRAEGAAAEPVVFHNRGRGVPGVLRPDATLIGREANGKPLALMIEYDRTRRASKQRERLRRYDDFLCQGWRRSRYAASELAPMLLVICSTDAQLPTFLRAIDEELTGWHADYPDAPAHVRSYPGRDLVVLTSRQRLLTGNPKVLIPSRLPPDERQLGRRSLDSDEFDWPVHRLLVGRAEAS